MFQTLRKLTDKYILLDTSYSDKKAEVLEYKKETEQLWLIKYVSHYFSMRYLVRLL